MDVKWATARRRAACYAIPALLVAVALRQVYLVRAHELTPWKGGGFGMFSSVDRGDYRFVRAYVITSQGEVPVDVGKRSAFARLGIRARYYPSHQRLSALANAVLRRSWEVDSGGGPRAVPVRQAAAGRARPLDSAATPLEVSAARVEVWRVQFDPESRSLTGRRLAHLTREHP